MKAEPHQSSLERWRFYPSPVSLLNLTLVFSVLAPKEVAPSVRPQDVLPGHCPSTAPVKRRRNEMRKQQPVKPHLGAKVNLSIQRPLEIKKCVNSAIWWILQSRLFSMQ